MTERKKKTERGYKFVEHTADAAVELRGESEEELFLNGLKALADLMGVQKPSCLSRRVVLLEAEDDEMLLSAWLNEIIYLACCRNFAPVSAKFNRLSGGKVEAVFSGGKSELSREVKAATLCGLKIKRDSNGLSAKVIFDL